MRRFTCSFCDAFTTFFPGKNDVKKSSTCLSKEKVCLGTFYVSNCGLRKLFLGFQRELQLWCKVSKNGFLECAICQQTAVLQVTHVVKLSRMVLCYMYVLTMCFGYSEVCFYYCKICLFMTSVKSILAAVKTVSTSTMRSGMKTI